MALKIPSNQIKFNYTAGGEYILKDTYRDYQGYYYETNGKTFAGKEFNQYAPELEKIQIKEGNNRRFNPLLASAATFIYGKISKFKIDTYIPVSIGGRAKLEETTRYFIKKINNNPILIKEINEEDFKKLQIQPNPIYQTISILFPEGGYFANQKSLDDAEIKMPGIKDFILSDLPPD
jgi:hypothetical protein